MYDESNAARTISAGRGSCHLNLLLFPSTQNVQVTTPNNGDIAGFEPFIIRLIIYIVVLGFLVIISFLVLKLLESCDDDENLEAEHSRVTGVPTETAPLLPQQKASKLPYGTDEDDLESGTSSSSEDLYDGKICAICYDMPRNCFFVPCGHCATCQDCARRITEVDNRICPICRRVIHKVRKVIIP
ncbi:OLC1v1016917C1 [Oldenlandia corymbosa var. corymbosa]|uniref:OLC1v1016917C1 n=1 Tax=Oldenlandia corymbosa var. corymbosa TaxID=529605 RepID=A0AAV1E892_OLDCO|nr:OLC1v1016917C1 [Oldenlandia corymbosa var. corymbosa]